MSSLLEILGRAITIDTADLILHWLSAVGTSRRLPAADKNHLAEIVELICRDKLETAAEQLRLYLFENSACVLGRMAAAAICLKENKLQRAIEELNSVYMRQPNNTMALYALGHCYERLSKEAQAVEFYQDCLKFKSYLELPAQRLAAISFKNGRVEQAIEQYELLRTEYPDDVRSLVTLGQLYIVAERYSDATETFNTAILIHPDNFQSDDEPEIEELIEEGRLHEALEETEKLLETQPHQAQLLMKRADILCMLGATGEAIPQYQQALRLCPDFLEATIKLGTAYLQLGRDDLAARQFNNGVETNDSIVDAYIGLATAYKLAGRTSDALATLSLAGAIQPNSSLLFAETATLHFKAELRRDHPFDSSTEQADLTEHAIEAHRRELSRRPRNPDLHYRLGILLMSTGELQTAAGLFRTALEINPLYDRARTKLAICLFETNQAREAVAQLIRPNCLDPATLNLHYQTALLYCNRLKFASSLLNLERTLEENYTCPAAAENISTVLQNLGILERTAATWEDLSQMVNQALDDDGTPPELAV